MPVRTVRADVVDISRDRPAQNDQFVVDTNSWYQLTYTRLLNNKKPEYPNYIKSAKQAGASLYACGVTLAELASAIENNEREIYRAVVSVDKKTFRHDCPTQRAVVVAEVKAAWAQVLNVARLAALVIDDGTTQRAISNFGTCVLDGYDLFIIEAMHRINVFNVITDDGDFATVPDIRVFTANTSTISAARSQRRLIER